MVSTELGVRDRETLGGFDWFVFRKGVFKSSFKKMFSDIYFLEIS